VRGEGGGENPRSLLTSRTRKHEGQESLDSWPCVGLVWAGLVWYGVPRPLPTPSGVSRHCGMVFPVRGERQAFGCKDRICTDNLQIMNLTLNY
jgi:hypothetical protein